MPLDTSIARSIKPLQIQFRDLGADYNQLAQLQSAESQNQLAQMQMQERQQLAPLRLQEQQSRATVAKMALDEVNEAQTYVKAVMAKAAEFPDAPRDPFVAAKQMIDHPNAQVQAAGLRLLESSQKLQDYKAEADYQTFRGQPVAGAPAAAAPGTVNATPVIPTTSPAAGKAIKPIATGVFADSTVSPENIRLLEKLGDQATFFDPTSYWTQNSDGKLVVGRSGTPVSAAPAAAGAPAQPDMANALALKIQGLEAQRNQLEPFLKSSSAKAKYDSLGKQIDNLSKGFSVSAGGAYFQPGVGMVAQPAAAPALSDVSRFIAERNAAVARNAPPDEIAALNAAIKKATTPAQGTTVNVNAGSKAEEVEFGQYVVNQYKEVSARADIATRSIPALDINLKTLDKGFDTGFGTETIAAGAKVLAALGVQNAKDFATDAQTFLANANSAVLQKQMEQKGVQTAADADRITSTGAQLGNTKEANKFILSVAKAQLQRDVAQRKFYSEWRDENKTFRGAEDAWYAGPGGASLFDSPILKKYAEPVAGQAENRKVGLDKIFKKAP